MDNEKFPAGLWPCGPHRYLLFVKNQNESKCYFISQDFSRTKKLKTAEFGDLYTSSLFDEYLELAENLLF